MVRLVPTVGAQPWNDNPLSLTRELAPDRSSSSSPGSSRGWRKKGRRPLIFEAVHRNKSFRGGAATAGTSRARTMRERSDGSAVRAAGITPTLHLPLI